MNKLLSILGVLCVLILSGCDMPLFTNYELKGTYIENCIQYQRVISSLYGEKRETVRSEPCIQINLKVTNKGSESKEVQFPLKMILVVENMEIDSFDYINTVGLLSETGKDFDIINLNCDYRRVLGKIETIYPDQSKSSNYCFSAKDFEENPNANLYFDFEGRERSIAIKEIIISR